MKIYIAGASLEAAMVNVLAERIELIDSVYDCSPTRVWTTPVIDLDGDRLMYTDREIMDADLRAIDDSDVLVFSVPRVMQTVGAYIEIGYAVGKGKRVLIYAPGKLAAIDNPMLSLQIVRSFEGLIGALMMYQRGPSLGKK